MAMTLVSEGFACLPEKLV